MRLLIPSISNILSLYHSYIQYLKWILYCPLKTTPFIEVSDMITHVNLRALISTLQKDIDDHRCTIFLCLIQHFQYFWSNFYLKT